MENNPINLATFKQHPVKLEQKLNSLSCQKSVLILGPMLSHMPETKTKQNIIQVDTCIFDQFDHSIILGDGDSVAHEQQKYFDYLFPVHKDFTDFEALLTLIKQFPLLEELHFYGFWGGRFDHHVLIPCQITELLLQTRNLKQAWIYDQNNLPTLQILNSGVHHFNEQIPFSIITTQQQLIELKGQVSYPGNFSLKAWSGHGISNFAQGRWSLECELPIWKYMLSNDPKELNL